MNRHMKKHIYTALITLGMALFIFTGCERAAPVQQQVAVTFSSIQQNVLTPSCAVSGCHLGGSAPLGLDLSAGNAYGNLVNIASGEIPRFMRVEPGNADSSYLVLKIEGDPVIIPERMPRGRAPLPADQIQAVRDWIEDGAPNN